MQNPHERVVTLLDMLHFNAAYFVFFNHTCRKFLGFIAGKENQALPLVVKEEAIQTFMILMKDTEPLDMPSVEDQLKRIVDLLDSQTCSTWEFGTELQELLKRFEDALQRKVFLALTTEEAQLFLDAQKIRETDHKFPQLAFDLEEASNCLALNRPTAAVFHLMRAMELALHILARKLKVSLKEDKNWGLILKEAREAAAKLPNTTSRQRRKREAYSEAFTHLDHVRLAWRNPVMHARGKYTRSEATRIFFAARAFMHHLTKI